MKRWNKVLALFLAVAVAVSNFPTVLASAESAELRTVQTSDTGMRFRQTDFDEETGILTMSLEVKPEDENGDLSSISQVYLAFQVDPLTVEPITSPETANAEAINVGYGSIGFVGPSKTMISEADDKVKTAAMWKKFVHSNGMGKRVDEDTLGINEALGTLVESQSGAMTGILNETGSGYFTSANRKSETGLLDCYLHLQFTKYYADFEEVTDTKDVNGNDLESGYVKVIDLYFQAYAGSASMTGERSPAKSSSALFRNSFHLPAGVATDASAEAATTNENDTLRDQFYVYRKTEMSGGTEQIYFATGVAGFTEEKRSAAGDDLDDNFQLHYGYGQEPRVADTKWHTSNIANHYAMGDDPTLSYENMDKRFIVLQMSASLENTYSFTSKTEGKDFYVKGETGEYPRYRVPYILDMDALIESEKGNLLWQPESQYESGKQVAMKYRLTTTVSASSDAKPEVPDEDNADALDEFLHSIEWKFALREAVGKPLTTLDSYTITYQDPLDTTAEETEAVTVTTYSDGEERTYEVRTAYIADLSSNYYGYAVQTVRETTQGGDNSTVWVTPVGVMLDFSEETEVYYLESNDAETATKANGYAPQLRIDETAAETRSYLWADKDGLAQRNGEIYLTAEYVDESGVHYSAPNEIKAKLYKDNKRAATYTELSVDTSYAVSGEENTYQIDIAQDDATLADVGIAVFAELFDQYGKNMTDSDGDLITPTVTITPDTETQAAIKTAGGVNAFGVEYDSNDNVYYLTYGNGKLYGANDVIAGTYVIKVTYTGVKEENVATCTLKVAKDKDKFSYMDSRVLLSSSDVSSANGLKYGEKTVVEDGEEIREIRLRVPTKVMKNGNYVEQNVTAEFDLLELANQWRDTENQAQTDLGAFDVVDGLRDKDGNIDKNILASVGMTLKFDWCNEDGSKTAIKGVTTTQLASSGTFTFNSSAGAGTRPASGYNTNDEIEGAPMYVTVTASYDGETKVNKYRIYFVREIRELTTIKGRYGTSTAGKDVTVQLQVPDEATGQTTHTIDFQPYDQYDEAMNWDDLQKGGQKWEMYIDSSSMKEDGKEVSSLTGVSLTGTNKSTIVVTNKAKPCTFNVYAKYSGTDTAKPSTNNKLTQKISVEITKPAAVPTKIISVQPAGNLDIKVPNKTEPNKVNKGGPTITVQDQYGNVMQKGTYREQWSVNKTLPTHISLDTATGVVSVESCAPAWSDVVMTVKLFDSNGNWCDIKNNSTFSGLRVVRNDPPEVTSLSVTTKSVSYPASSDTTRSATLAALVETEYGAEAALTEEDKATWVLESVEYAGGGKSTYREPKVDGSGKQEVDDDGELVWTYPSSTEMNYDNNLNTYTDIRKAVTLSSKTGEVQFLKNITDSNYAPVKITVSCTLGEKMSYVTIPVQYDGKAFDSSNRVPESIRILDNVKTLINIPEGTNTVTKTLDAEVSDKYGFLIRNGAANAACQWEIVEENLAGVSIVDGTQLVVTKAAQNGVVTVRATYTQNSKTVTKEQGITMTRNSDSKPTTLVPLNIEELGDDEMQTVEIPMPGFTGPATDPNGKTLKNAESVTYTLNSKVLDGYDLPLTAQTVKWEIQTDTYNLATISENNKLTIQCTQDWLNAARNDATITLLGYDTSDKVNVNATVILTVKKQAAKAIYAMPQLEQIPRDTSGTWPVYSDNPGFESYLLIPSIADIKENGGAPYEAHFTATVYSQYREEMNDVGAEFDYRNPGNMSNNIEGLTMKTQTAEEKAARKGVLYINSNVDVNTQNLYIVAKPCGDNTEDAVMDTAVNRCLLQFDAGASYPAGVVFGDSYTDQAPATSDHNVPKWQPGENDNIYTPGVQYSEFTLSAIVHDQKGGNYAGFGLADVYPVWGLVDGTVEGVTFENPTDDSSKDNEFDSNGNPKGNTVRVWVSNEVLAQSEVARELKIKVWVSTEEQTGDCVAIQTVTLQKNPSVAKHLYFNNVLKTDEQDGVGVAETLERPGVGETTTVSISAMTYDDYGYAKPDVATSITIKESSLPDGIHVENLTAATQDATAAARAASAGQKIVQNGKTLAKFVAPANGVGEGTLTLYSSCDLEQIEFEVRCSTIDGVVKTLRFPIQQQEKVAKQAVLCDSETGEPVSAVEFIFGKSTEEVPTGRYFVKIYDQYEELMDEELAKDITATWLLLCKDGAGEWVPYVEQDADGNELDEESKFIRYQADETDKFITLFLNVKNYKKALTLRLECDLTSTGVSVDGVTLDPIEFTIRRRSSGTSGSVSASGAYTITYDAGEHGELVGFLTGETVLEGTGAKLVPNVDAEEGYAHCGWLLNNELVRDPATLEVQSDITLVANYIKLDEVAFVSGYEDDTVRPTNNVTRGEFVRMLVGALTNYSPEEHAKYANPFEDVSENRYYRDYIAYAYFYGIVSGYSDDTFRPEEPITRAEAAVMMAKAKNLEPSYESVRFRDVKTDSWYYGYVESLAEAGYINGYENGKFYPKKLLTRAEAMTMLVRASESAPNDRELEYLHQTVKTTFKDLPKSYWATPYVLRAAGLA